VTDSDPLFFRVDEVMPGCAAGKPGECPLSGLIGFVNLAQEPRDFTFFHESILSYARR
jgi:hypothetical protein